MICEKYLTQKSNESKVILQSLLVGSLCILFMALVRKNNTVINVVIMLLLFIPLLLKLLEPRKHTSQSDKKAWSELQSVRRKELEHTNEYAKMAVDSRLDPTLIFYVFPFIATVLLVFLMPKVPLPVTVGRVFSLVFLALGLLSLQNKRLIDDTPTIKARGVFIGQVELIGTAESDAPLTSYITETKCVHYSWKVEEQNEVNQWIIVSKGEESSPFYLMDDTGAIRIDPINASFYPTINKLTVNRTDPLFYDKGPPSNDKRGSTRILTETLIPLHASLYVIGHARERQDRVAAEVTYDEDTPLFVISTQAEKQVSSKYRNQSISLFALGYILSMLVPWSFGTSTIGVNLYSSIIFVVALILGWSLVVYNGLVNLRNIVDQAWSMIDVQLQRRSDLIPNLVKIIEGYKEFEKEVQTQITKLRAQSMNHDNPSEVSSLLRSFAEAYPELKARQQFLDLQQSLEDTEQRIALARDYYNEQTRFYNTRITVVPDMFVAKIGGFKPKQYWEIGSFQREQEEIDFVS